MTDWIKQGVVWFAYNTFYIWKDVYAIKMCVKLLQWNLILQFLNDLRLETASVSETKFQKLVLRTKRYN